MPSTVIVAAARPDELDRVRALFRAYQRDLGVDLCFQGFEDELARLPGEYAAPGGALLVARADAEPVGCVALRPLDAGLCEMKRLFVLPDHRASGAGRSLAQAIVLEARRLGYVGMRLDTLSTLTRAMHLYATLGFRRIAPYNDNPLAGAVFYELRWA